MPRFGIKAQISLLSLVLLVIPWLAWNYWQEMQEAAISAQGRVQLIETKAIATSLVATQENIGELLAGDDNSELKRYALSTPVVSEPIRLDGRFTDWGVQVSTLESRASGFSLWRAESVDVSETAFGLALAQNAQYLYLALSVRDDFIQPRQTNHLRLDYNDHVQLTYRDNHGALRRIIIPAEGEGDLASYETDFNWTHGIDREHPVTGEIIASHKTGIQGYWRNTKDGYAIELRITTSALSEQDPRLHVGVVDVDANPAYGPSAILASLPKKLETELNLLGLHAREFQRTIDQLKTTYARLWVYDRQGREWAYGGREAFGAVNPQPFDTRCVQDALQGNDQSLQYVSSGSGDLERIVACHPIVDHGEVLGVVVIDESASHVLAQAQEKVEQVAIRLGSAVAILLIALFGYAVILVRRIARLNDESRRTIDTHGRIEKTQLESSRDFPDELGDLSRTMSALLEKQLAYTRFIERIPQTLRHEISNPLNKLRTSLELLYEDAPQLSSNKYIKRIENGTEQISQITQHLTEAASLESAIQEEPLTRIDLNAFLQRYFESWEDQVQITMDSQPPFFIQGDTSRLEQLFDKIMDNALGFRTKDSEVRIRIHREQHKMAIEIENDGPLFKTEDPNQLFAPMASTRSSGAQIHLGLGLYIAKLIADKHGASISARNLETGNGVVVDIRFPELV